MPTAIGPASPATLTLTAVPGGVVNKPSFDFFDGALDLDDSGGTLTFDNTMFTMETGEYPPSPGTNRYSAWFTWTPTVTRSVRVHARNSPDAATAGMDVRVFTDTWASAAAAYGNSIQLRPQLSEDGSVYTGTDDAYWRAVAGTTYRIQVSATTPHDDNVIVWGTSPAPDNDEFASAYELANYAGTVYFTNLFTTSEPGDTAVGSYGALGRSLWYKWTAQAAGTTTFDTLDSGSVDTTLEVFTGLTLAGLTLVASNDNGSGAATVSFSAVVGTTYYIRLNARQDVASGGVLMWTGQATVASLRAPADARVRVAIYEPDGVTLIAYLPRRRAVKWQNELNAPGTASFEMHLDDEILDEHPTLLNPFNIVKYHLNGIGVKVWQIEDLNRVETSPGEAADRWVTVSGRGGMSLLETAIVYPEYGLTQLAGEDRHFDFSSRDGDWRNPTEWIKPIGYTWASDTTGKRGKPVGWPDPSAYWIWSTSPALTAPAGINWFRATINLTVATPVAMYIAVDDQYTLYVDGLIVRASDPNKSSWNSIATYKTTLTAGLHTIAIKAINWYRAGATSTNNPGAVLFSMFKTSDSGATLPVCLLRSDLTHWMVKGYGATPGWHSATILKQLIEEAKGRAVRALLPITYDFTNFVDSSGQPWGDVQDRIVKIGTSDLLSLATELIELAMDLDVSTDLVMRAWKHRGSDKSGIVRILPSRDVLQSAPTVRGAKVRNQAILKSSSGWLEIFATASKETWGRREVGLSVGNAGSANQLALVGAAAMSEISQPDRTIPLGYSSASGPQPFIDYDLGDVIAVPGEGGTMNAGRVMAVTGEEEDSIIKWDLDLYPQVPPDAIDTAVISTGTSFGDRSELYKHEVLSDSPWGYWRLTETGGSTFLDSSGHGRRMYKSGTGASLAQVGPINKALAWTAGSTGYASPAGFPYKSGIVTLEAWILLTATPSGTTNIIGMAYPGPGGATHDKELYLTTDSKIHFRVFTGGASRVITYGSALSLNVWHHVVGSVGGSGMKLYVDGTKRSYSTTYKSSSTLSQYVYMRAGGAGFNGKAQLKLAEPAVYFQQLLDSRIASHFRAGSGLV